MTLKSRYSIAASLVALTMISGTAVLAENHVVEDPAAEAQAFLASPTSMAAATATAETETGGKVASIEYQTGENGAPDLIMADVVMPDGTEKTVAINPADGKVMNVTLASNDQNEGEGESGGDTESEGNDGADGGSEGAEGAEGGSESGEAGEGTNN